MDSYHSGNVPEMPVRAGEYAGNCNCAFKTPTVPTCRDPHEHLDDCPAKGTGYPVGLVVLSTAPHLTRLTTALENWGRHFDWCAIKRSSELAFVQCDCGLAREIEYARSLQPAVSPPSPLGAGGEP